LIEAFVGLGSNLGDRLGNLGAAVDQLAREPGFVLRRVSLAYETEPVGPPQPRYLNAAAQVGTLLSARAVFGSNTPCVRLSPYTGSCSVVQ